MFNKRNREERRIRRLLANIERKQTALMVDMTRLAAAVAANTDAVNAAVAKLNAPSTPTQDELDAQAAQIETNNTSLATAVTPPAPAVA